jgi:tetratricopeptide (TPR) repeat protein
MRHRRPADHADRTVRRTLTGVATVTLLSASLYVAGGCRSPKAARDESALNSYVQGVMAYQKGDTTKAMANLQEAVNKKNDLVMARSMLGDLHRARSDYNAAQEQYEALTRLDPYAYNNHYRLGLVYQLLERLQDAAASYLKALNLKPDDAASNMSLGTVYYALGQPSEAVKYAEKAVQYDPTSAAAWVNYGLILDATNNFAKAEGAYRKSVDLDSNNPVTRLYLGENLLSQKKYGEARSVFAELVRVQDSPLHRKRLGDAYAGEGNLPEAMNRYQAVLKQDPNYYPALNAIGESYIMQYRNGKGIDDAKRKSAVDAWQQSLAINRAQPRVMALVQQYAKAPMFLPE